MSNILNLQVTGSDELTIPQAAEYSFCAYSINNEQRSFYGEVITPYTKLITKFKFTTLQKILPPNTEYVLKLHGKKFILKMYKNDAKNVSENKKIIQNIQAFLFTLIVDTDISLKI